VVLVISLAIYRATESSKAASSLAVGCWLGQMSLVSWPSPTYPSSGLSAKGPLSCLSFAVSELSSSPAGGAADPAASSRRGELASLSSSSGMVDVAVDCVLTADVGGGGVATTAAGGGVATAGRLVGDWANR